jgi:amino acid transporter
VFARTSRAGTPYIASAVQSGIGLAVIVLYAVAGWDPMVKLFFYLGTTGGLGVLLLITITSFSVIGFFRRDRRGEPLWHRVIAPGVAGVLLVGMSYLVCAHFATLLGVPSGTTAAWALPTVYPVVAAVGLVWALILRARRPEVYAAIGLGARAASTRGTGQPDGRSMIGAPDSGATPGPEHGAGSEPEATFMSHRHPFSGGVQ